MRFDVDRSIVCNGRLLFFRAALSDEVTKQVKATELGSISNAMVTLLNGLGAEIETSVVAGFIPFDVVGAKGFRLAVPACIPAC